MQGDPDGWNTVPAKPVRQQIDATKMKITKVNLHYSKKSKTETTGNNQNTQEVKMMLFYDVIAAD